VAAERMAAAVALAIVVMIGILWLGRAAEFTTIRLGFFTEV